MEVIRILFAYILMMVGVLVALLAGACVYGGVWPLLVVVVVGLLIIGAGWKLRKPRGKYEPDYNADPDSADWSKGSVKKPILAGIAFMAGAVIEFFVLMKMAKIATHQEVMQPLDLLFICTMLIAGGAFILWAWKILQATRDKGDKK